MIFIFEIKKDGKWIFVKSVKAWHLLLDFLFSDKPPFSVRFIRKPVVEVLPLALVNKALDLSDGAKINIDMNRFILQKFAVIDNNYFYDVVDFLFYFNTSENLIDLIKYLKKFSLHIDKYEDWRVIALW